MRVGADAAVCVLPHCPCFPVVRDDWRRAVLREPEPAISEHRVCVCAEQFFDVVAGIETGPASRYALDVCDEGARFFEAHAGAVRVRLEV